METALHENPPKEVVEKMATQAMRLHHYLWHSVRDNWFDLTPEAQKRIIELGWVPGTKDDIRPAWEKDKKSPIYGNNAGKDFLYMHREMIKMVNEIASTSSNPDWRVVGWEKIPEPTDNNYPVEYYEVTAEEAGGQKNADDINNYLRRVKPSSYYESRMKLLADDFDNPDKWVGISLGEFGARLETAIHNQIHMRWTNKPGERGIRPDPDPQKPDQDYPDPTRWTDSDYMWLGDQYASHVNPIFWRIHGWVDDRIKIWEKANNAVADFKGAWSGPHGMPIHGVPTLSRHDGHYERMKETLSILAKEKACAHFYDHLDFEEHPQSMKDTTTTARQTSSPLHSKLTISTRKEQGLDEQKIVSLTK